LNFKNILNRYLGDGFAEDLVKSEAGVILKPDANVTISPHEMYIALQIVPRTVISILVQYLKPLEKGQHVDIPWPVEEGKTHTVSINKIASDLYSGQIIGEGRILCKFNYRSLPAVGLMIMSTYELYDKETNKQDIAHPEIDYNKVQRMIDDKIRLQMMIEDVVTKKVSEHEAIKQLINQKISDFLRTSEAIKETILPRNHEDIDINDVPSNNEEEAEENIDNDQEEDQNDLNIDDINMDTKLMSDIKSNKKNKLKTFLNSKKVKKNSTKEVIINNNKDLHCHICDSKIYKSGDKHIECCLCYGEWMGEKIKFTKNESGVKFNFPKKFDIDNIEILLENFKKNK
jgi:hypothetical protein